MCRGWNEVEAGIGGKPSMAMVMFRRAAHRVFVHSRNRVNMQIGAPIISDHHLPGAAHSVVPDVVAGHSIGKSTPVDIHMYPSLSRGLSRIIPHKDGV